MRGFVKALGAACLLVMVSATAASAQSEFEGQARSYLEAGMEAHTAQGYHRETSIPDLATALRLEHPRLWAVNLRRGVNYRVYGACDNDCSDLDMEIYDADGELADRDAATNDTPYVQITPARTGLHYVRLWVYACTEEPCYAAARVVSGGTPTERMDEAPPEAAADEDYLGVVRSELDAAGAAHLAAGYETLGEDGVEPIMLAGDGYRQTIHLDRGAAYIFQGACDQDCTDVDLEVLDPAGAQVGQDVAVDDRPVVALNAAQSGDYVVRVWLAQCSIEPCYVGLRSFKR